MIAPRNLKVSIVVGQVSHAQAVIDDLRQRAMAAAASPAWAVSVDVVQVGSLTDGDAPGGGEGIVRLQAERPAPAAARLGALAGKPGPVGVAGRLVRDNLESRRVASTLSRHKDVVAALRSSAVVVAADPSADRAVWQLRRATGAHLVHGPAAMVHAIKALANG